MAEVLITFVLSQVALLVLSAILNLGRNRLSNTMLALLYANVAVSAVIVYLYLHYGTAVAIRLRGAMAPHVMGVGPLLYFYLQSELNPGFQFRKKHILSLLPYVGGVLVAVYAMYAFDAHERAQMQTQLWSFNALNVIRLLDSAVVGYFLVKSYQLVRKRSLLLEEVTANQDIVKQNWALLLCGIVFGILLLMLMFAVFGASNVTVVVALLTMALLFFTAALYGHFHSKVYGLDKECEEFLAARNSSNGHFSQIENGQKYKTSGLTPEQIDSYSQKIVEALNDNTQEVFDPLFQLSRLAKMVGLSNSVTSQMLSMGLGKSFYDLVNEFRIEKAKQMLADPASFQTSILDVGLSVGYNSKSTFNAAFRRIVGETPSAFRKANAHGQ